MKIIMMINNGLSSMTAFLEEQSGLINRTALMIDPVIFRQRTFPDQEVALVSLGS